ncbi:hypothetical protein HYZ78_00555 [Candidatus Microgenomates bacterium]|nr:hypothetical protein [Candidatus Microgenomates bacterium]
MKKFFKWVLIGIVALIVIGVISSSGKGGSKTSPLSSSTPAPEAMKITARQLADDFDENQVAAENKWKDKFVEFSSTISNITDSGLSFYNVASKEFSGTQISCRVVDKQQLLSLKNGQTVTVRGTVGGQTIGVIDINNCSTVQ